MLKNGHTLVTNQPNAFTYENFTIINFFILDWENESRYRRKYRMSGKKYLLNSGPSNN